MSDKNKSKSLGYRTKYSLAKLGGLNGHKLITGAAFYTFADFLNQANLGVYIENDFINNARALFVTFRGEFLCPSIAFGGICLMILGIGHKIHKFLFPKDLAGL